MELFWKDSLPFIHKKVLEGPNFKIVIKNNRPCGPVEEFGYNHFNDTLILFFFQMCHMCPQFSIFSPFGDR